ncbi:MAG: sigma-70 family RNA polymerase sigma factor [Actinomycetota bacterium]|nr:sigma-70 family RNA polymerase sigma factor [Actinomycetota bacterium]
MDKIRLRSKTKDKKVSLDKMTEDYEIIFENYRQNLENDYFTTETVKEVLKIIVELDENYRIPLILRDLQDYSYREIAKLTGKPIGTVKTNIHRARKMIKDKIKGYK